MCLASCEFRSPPNTEGPRPKRFGFWSKFDCMIVMSLRSLEKAYGGLEGECKPLSGGLNPQNPEAVWSARPTSAQKKEALTASIFFFFAHNAS